MCSWIKWPFTFTVFHCVQNVRATSPTMFLVPACVWHVVCICRHFSAHPYPFTSNMNGPTQKRDFSCSESYLLHPCTGCHAAHARISDLAFAAPCGRTAAVHFATVFRLPYRHKSLFKNYVPWLRLRAEVKCMRWALIPLRTPHRPATFSDTQHIFDFPCEFTMDDAHTHTHSIDSQVPNSNRFSVFVVVVGRTRDTHTI